jgi:hypothetical protein
MFGGCESIPIGSLCRAPTGFVTALRRALGIGPRLWRPRFVEEVMRSNDATGAAAPASRTEKACQRWLPGHSTRAATNRLAAVLLALELF